MKVRDEMREVMAGYTDSPVQRRSKEMRALDEAVVIALLGEIDLFERHAGQWTLDEGGTVEFRDARVHARFTHLSQEIAQNRARYDEVVRMPIEGR